MAGRRFASAWVTVAAFFVCAAHASGGLPALDRMMLELAPESARAADIIRTSYQEHLDVLTLREFAEIAGALDNGGLVPLPDNPEQFNVVPRLDGPHPIGELDMDNQASYAAGRAATIGVLLEIASRVKSGPVEVTSLVRHGDYQEELRSTNANAITSVPMHTMGLAVDIGVLNTPLKTVYEIRDVLQQMQNAGDILFIGERKQLVFHVVPHPARLGHFNEVYLRAAGPTLTGRFAEAVAFSRELSLVPAPVLPRVTTEIVAMLPVDGPAENLWVEPHAAASPGPTPRSAVAQASLGVSILWNYWRGAEGGRWLFLVLACSAAWWCIRRPPALATLFDRSSLR